MPLYEYVCSSCRDAFELLVRNGEKPECPSCGSRSLNQQLSVVAAHTASASSMPGCGSPSPMPMGCGLPQCGAGRCAME